MALTTIRLIKVHLPEVLADADNVEARRQVQTAALLGGLSTGVTQSALAHSISYPFTAHFGVPHGIACSFTLPEIARYNGAEAPGCVAPIADAFDTTLESLPDTLGNWLEKLSIGTHLSTYVEPSVTDQFNNNLITRTRAANNIRDIDTATACDLARKSLERFC